jgi:hypothetical protein
VRLRIRLAIVALGIVGLIAYAWVRLQQGQTAFGTSATPQLNAQLNPNAVRWLKGQLHVHSSKSADGKQPPEEVARWYAAHGYDFIVFTDHNQITSLPPVDGMLVLPGIEITQNLEICYPPPLPGFNCLLHVNALFVDPAGKLELKPSGSSRADIYGRAIDAARALGGVAQINHPNFHYGAADPALLVELSKRGATLLEIAAAAADSDNEGDATHLSTEALWDAALDGGAKLYGTATDDAHDFADPLEPHDRGFVMVMAKKTPQDIREALEHGQFYASTGLLLSQAGEVDGGYTVTHGMLGRTTISGPQGKAWTQPRFAP